MEESQCYWLFVQRGSSIGIFMAAVSKLGRTASASARATSTALPGENRIPLHFGYLPKGAVGSCIHFLGTNYQSMEEPSRGGRTIVYEISPSLFLLLLPWFLWTFFSLLLVILVAENFSVFLPEPAFPTFQNQIVRWMMGSFFFPASIHFFLGASMR